MAALMEMNDLVEAFLLRLPPDDPASLVRAALVCKLWRRILADRGFRRRFCELHRRPPMLGYLVFRSHKNRPFFTPTSSFRPSNADLRGLTVIDSHHGRVLLRGSSLLSQTLDAKLAVWDPILGDLLELELPKLPRHPASTEIRFNAAVLCASNPSSACDSIECHRGHFLVVLIITSRHRVYVFVYSSQAGMWSETTSAAQDSLVPKSMIPFENSQALAGNALYFKFLQVPESEGILKYHLGMREISWINLPSNYRASEIMLTTTEYGGLGIARVESSRLHLWSREAGPGGHLEWAPSRVIELNMVLPANIHSIDVVAFVHGHGAFLVSTHDDGVFSVDLESNCATKVCKYRCIGKCVPYMCFCTPALDAAPTNTGEGPGPSVPSA